MVNGILSGFFWGADTSLIGFYFSSVNPYISELLIFPLFITYIHDTISAIAVNIAILVSQKYHIVRKDIVKLNSFYIWMGAFLGGPVGMCSYIASVYFIGPSLTAIISSLYPAMGFLWAYLFLKEKRASYQIASLFIAIIFSVILGFTSDTREFSINSGIIFSFICICAWGSEAVLCSYGMKKGRISNLSAVCIRQTLSMITYSLIFGLAYIFSNTISNLPVKTDNIYICISALSGTVSYYFYYRSIFKVGPSRAMALNISYSGFAIIFSYFLLGEALTITQMIFGAFIVLSGVISAYDFKK